MSVANPVIDSIDGPNRLIFLRSGVSVWNPIDDIYVEVRNRRRTDTSLRRFFPFCEALPLIEKGTGIFTGRGLVLLQGTRIVPFNENATHTITGELLSDEGITGTDLIDTSTLTSKIKINYVPPPATEVQVVGSGVAPPTAEENADAVWTRLIEAGFTAEQVARIILAATAGKGGDDGNGTYRYRDIADTKDRIVAPVSGSERTSVALDPS